MGACRVKASKRPESSDPSLREVFHKVGYNLAYASRSVRTWRNPTGHFRSGSRPNPCRKTSRGQGLPPSASYTLIGAIILLGGIGYAVDSWQGTAPWGLVIGLLLGVVVGFYELVKMISAEMTSREGARGPVAWMIAGGVGTWLVVLVSDRLRTRVMPELAARHGGAARERRRDLADARAHAAGRRPSGCTNVMMTAFAVKVAALWRCIVVAGPQSAWRCARCRSC